MRASVDDGTFEGFCVSFVQLETCQLARAYVYVVSHFLKWRGDSEKMLEGLEFFGNQPVRASEESDSRVVSQKEVKLVVESRCC